MIQHLSENPSESEHGPSPAFPDTRRNLQRLRQGPLTPESVIRRTEIPKHLRLPEHVSWKAWGILKSNVENQGIVVREDHVESPHIARHDGLTITVDPRLDRSTKLFFLMHFFGHIVQATAPAFRESTKSFIQRRTLGNDDRYQEFLRYEAEDTALGLHLMERAHLNRTVGHDVTTWYREMAAKDCAYTEANVVEGKNLPFSEFENVRYPLFDNLRPLPIPEFTPKTLEPYYAD